MMKFPKKIRIIELNDISFQDNKDMIMIKHEKDFEWLVKRFTDSVMRLKHTYYIFDSEAVYVYHEVQENGKF